MWNTPGSLTFSEYNPYKATRGIFLKSCLCCAVHAFQSAYPGRKQWGFELNEAHSF